MRRVWRWTWRIGAAMVAAVVLYCLLPIRPTVERMRPGSGTGFWELETGHRIAYRRVRAAAGVEPRAPVVFLHGGPGGYVHSSVIEALAPLAGRGHELYFYEQVGSGLSERLPRPKDYSFLGHVADLEAIVRDEIGAERVILVGHSYGGMLAAQFVAMHPERVERVVLSSPGVLEPARFDDEGRWLNEIEYPVPAGLEFVEVDRVPMDGMRFWPPRALASMAVATVFFVGCTRTSPHSPVPPVMAYDFEVRRPGGGHTKGQAATFSVEDGTNTVELKDGRLTVNGKAFGTIAGGAKIVVDEAGKVTVNGQPRSPE